MNRFTRTCVLTLAVGSLSSSALADGQADDRHREGVASFKKWDFENARQSFLQAYALDPSAKFLWDLALAEAKSNHPAEALRHYRLYFKLPDAKEADRRKVKTVIEDAEKKTGHVRVDLPAGASLSVDGERIDEKLLDAPLDVAAGNHTFVAAFGEKRASVSAALTAGQSTELALKFDAEPTVAFTPPVPVPVATGMSTTSPETPAASASWPPAGAWVSGAVGVVGVGVGVGFLAAALSKDSTVSDANAAKVCANITSSACATAEDAKSARNRDAVISGVGFGVGLVGLGVATVWAVTTHNRAPAAAWILPEVGPGRAGFAAGTTF